ncbi:MAG: hypothetical protein F4Y62_02200 [Rhodospirillaceae bacterium]|nr:hypothetical protein [Rhodospirillaceae bacterium]MYK12643.1 hypothetical protein [Rhodospirillaceae bacterium]
MVFRSVGDAALASKLTVEIRSNSAGSPGALVGTLTNPASIPTSTSAQTINFTHSGLDLAAGTTYWLVIDLSGNPGSGDRIGNTVSDAEDNGATSGWNIADNSRWRNRDNTGAWVNIVNSIKIGINGAVKTANSAPTVANAIPDQSATAGTAFSYQFPANTFSDADSGDTLSYTAMLSDGSGLPSWLGFTALTRTFSGTPAAGDAGSLTVRVTANDGNGGTVYDDFVITVGSAAMPVVSITGGGGVTEGGTASFTISANPAPTTPITVNVDVSQSGDFGVTTGARTVTVSGASTTLTVNTADDSTAEANGSVTVTLQSGQGYTVSSSQGAATVAVNDNDQPVGPMGSDVHMRIEAGASVTEGSPVTFTLHADPAPMEALAVTLNVRDRPGCLKNDLDLCFLADGERGRRTVTFPVGQSSHTFMMQTVADSTDEASGPVRVYLVDLPGDGYYKTAWGHLADVRVEDDDETTVTLEVTDALAVESGGSAGADTAAFVVGTGRKLRAGERVSVRLDFTGSPDWRLESVHSGIKFDWDTNTAVFDEHTNRAGEVILRATDDGEPEDADEVVTVSLGTIVHSGMGGGVRGTPLDNGQITLADIVWRNGEPWVSFESVSLQKREDAGTVELKVTVDPPPATAFDLNFRLSGTATRGSDYQIAGVTGDSGSVTVPAGATTATIPVQIIDDAVEDDGETIEVRLLTSRDYRTVQPGRATLTIRNDETSSPADDDAPVRAAAQDGTAPPAGTALPGTVAAPLTSGVVTLARPSGWTGSGKIQFGGGPVKTRDRGRFATLRIENVGADSFEVRWASRDAGTRRLTLEWQPVAGSSWQPSDGPAQDPRVLTVEDPAPAQQAAIEPSVTISAGASPVTEGADAVFTLTANPAPATPLAVTVAVTANGDYGIAGGTQTVTIPTGGSVALTLPTTDDGTDEPDGSATATVEAGNGYTIGSPASGTVAIRDNDDPPVILPTITIAAGTSPVTEGGDAAFTLTATPAPSTPLAVTVAVAAAGDYGVTAGSRTVTIPTTGSVTLTLPTTDDALDEPDGSASVTVQDGNGYSVGSPASGSVVIRDDDLPPPAVSIAAKTAAITEGGNAVFTITADRAPAADLPVSVAVSESGGGDHVAAQHEGAATATIVKGTTTAEIAVPTEDDGADEPDGAVTATLKGGNGYTLGGTSSASVSVADNDASTLPKLSVDDVTAREGTLAEVTIRLSAPSTVPVRVDVGSREANPVSARAHHDFMVFTWRGSYGPVFRPGETVRTVKFWIADDSHDDGGETFEVFLSNARGAPIGDGVGIVTIENDDPLPAAWLKRFGRTVAQQALDGIADRIAAPREAGMQGTLAGQALSFDPNAGDAAGPANAQSGANGKTALAMAGIARGFGADASAPAGPGPVFGAGPGSAANPFGDRSGPGFGASSPQTQTMTAQDALLGSSFSLTGAKDGSGGSLAFWGRASQGSFDGTERGDGTDIRLDGTATTGMLGADYARGKWLVGLALAQSSAEGDYAALGAPGCPETDGEMPVLCDGGVRAGDGKIEASLTAAIPYAAWQTSERLKLWGAAGYGSGEVTVKTAPGGNYKADTTWSMAAAGVRSDLLEAPKEGSPGSGSGASGPALALTSDALWTRTTSEKTRDLAASQSDTTRLRLGLEGSYRIAMEGGASLVPKLEIGARHDGGDAESGFGVELGGGIAWTDPELGLSLDLSGRTLIAHEDSDFEDRGYSASLGFDPNPATARGPSLSLRQDWGGQATGGLDALFAPDPLAERTGDGGSTAATSRWAMEAAYGFPVFGDRFTGSRRGEPEGRHRARLRQARSQRGRGEGGQSRRRRGGPLAQVVRGGARKHRRHGALARAPPADQRAYPRAPCPRGPHPRPRDGVRTAGLQGLHQCREGARGQLRTGRRGGLPPPLQEDRRREGRRTPGDRHRSQAARGAAR